MIDVKRLLKRCCAALLAALLLIPTSAALAEETALYEGPVLAFNAPRDAELNLNDMTADSYAQSLYSPGSGEVIVSAAFAAADERDAWIGALMGDTSAAVPAAEFDSLQGYGARRAVLTAAYTGGENLVMAGLAQAGVRYVVNIVTVDAARAYLFVAAMPESAFIGEGMDEVVEAQIESLEIFDPAARIMLVPEDGTDAYNLAGDILQDADADAFLVYALDAIRNVRLATVTLDAQGRLAPDAEVGAWSGMNFGDAIRIRAFLPDVLPGFAVSFTDAGGAESTLYITMSGLDGALMLIGD